MYLQKQDQRFDRLGGLGSQEDLEDGLESSREPKGLESPVGGWSG